MSNRVVGVTETDGERRFRTRGDANEESDPEPVSGEQVLVQAENMAPGDSASGSVVVENAGATEGMLTLANIAVTDAENGLTGPEHAAGDDASAGELSEHVEVRLWLAYEDGSSEYLVGSDGARVAMAALDGTTVTGTGSIGGSERATLGLQVVLPDVTGNEVQSDTVEFALDIVLREA